MLGRVIKCKALAQINFDPNLKTDKNSGVINTKLIIKHINHPHMENFPVSGEFCFPNLDFQKNEIDFGATMNDTAKKMSITVTNVSKIAANFQ